MFPHCNVRPYKPTLAGHTKSLQPYQLRDIAEVVIQTDLGLTAQMRGRHLISGVASTTTALRVPSALSRPMPYVMPSLTPTSPRSPKLSQYATFFNLPPCLPQDNLSTCQLVLSLCPPPPPPLPAVTTKLESTLCHQKPFTPIVHIGGRGPVRIPP